MKPRYTITVGINKGPKLQVYTFRRRKEAQILSRWAKDHGCFSFYDPRSDLAVDTLEWWVAAINHGCPIRDIVP